MDKSLIKKSLLAGLISSTIAAAGCGGGGGGGTPPPEPTTLSGTAAAGAAVIGTVTVKGALGNTNSALIEADGSYDVDVTGLTAPYRLRAQGTVGGRQVKLFSYAVESDIGGTVNITPFTDLIIANVAGQLAENFFDQPQQANPLDEADIEAQETELQAKLQDVLSAVGVGASIDLLRTSFSADHSGLDAVLDIVRVEVDPVNIEATITNLVENTSITDDLQNTGETTTLTVNDPAALLTSADETQAIKALFDGFTAAFATGLPTGSTLTAVQNAFADDFLEDGYNKSLFLSEITTDPTMIGSFFSGIVVSNPDFGAATPTAEVTFSYGSNGVLEPEAETWFMAKDPTLGWQFRGDQRIVETYFSFHCNDYDGFAADPTTPWACGINTQFWDEDFTVNGTGGLPIASGTVRIIDGTDGTTVKDVIYLGTPSWATAGNVQVYNEANNGGAADNNYQGDYRGFGTAAGETDPSIFVAGDIIEYALYTADLDVSTLTAPAVVGAPVATYTDTLVYAPNPVEWSASSNKLPTATSATQTAIQNYSIGSDLTIGWTLAAGTRIEEIMVTITDSAGDRVEIWDWIYGTTATSKTYSAAELDISNLLQNDTYELRVRIYATDEVNGQTHSRDYAVYNINGTGGGSTGGDCDVTVITTYAAFETQMLACSTFQPLVAADLIGNSYSFVAAPNEITTYTDASNGTFSNDGGSTTTPFTWSVDVNGILHIDFTAFGITDSIAAYGIDGSTGGLLTKAFTTETNSTYEEIVVPAGGGAPSLTCSFESAWDSINDQPAIFNSYDDYLTVLTDCGGTQTLTSVDVEGVWVDSYTDVDGDWVETITFNANGTGTYVETLNTVQQGSIDFTWSVTNNIVMMSGSIPSVFAFLEYWAIGANGTMKFYSEADDWTPPSDLSITDTTTLDGEIWTGNYIKQ